MRSLIAKIELFSSRRPLLPFTHTALMVGFSISASGQTPQVIPEAPFISPIPGTYTTMRNLMISDSTPGVAIYYTTDGSVPTTSSKLYTGPTIIAAVPMKETISAIAVRAGVMSKVKTSAIVMLPAAPVPVFSVRQGSYMNPQDVTLANPPGLNGAIHFTTDGSLPTMQSPVYAGQSIHITQLKTVSAFTSASNGYTQGLVGIQTFSILPTTPFIAPASGTYNRGPVVTMIDNTPGSVIHYTLDGSVPTATSAAYTGPITLPSTASATTIRAIATLAGVPGFGTTNAYKVVPTAVVPTPVISPASGTYATSKPIVISDTLAGARIYYTLDGSTPTSGSPLYTGPFNAPPTASGKTSIRAIAGLSGQITSALAASDITLSLPKGEIASVDVDPYATRNAIPADFLGFSHEWGAAQAMMGQSSTGVNAGYRTLVSTLTNAMGGPLVIRVGGGTTDHSGDATLPAVEPLAELAKSSKVSFILGVNLGGNDVALAAQQAKVYAEALPAGSIRSMEIGNEPDGYAASGLRYATYSWNDYLAQYQQWKQSVVTASPKVKLPVAGPTLGGGGPWMLDAVTAVKSGAIDAALITQHKYVGCYNSASPFASDILLQPASSTTAMGLGLQSYVTAAHQQGEPLRVAEMGSICLGGQSGVSDTFSSALWAIDTMFEYANLGVDGVNWNSNSNNGPNDLFRFITYKNKYYVKNVNPLYYGLLFFAKAAGGGAELLTPATSTSANLKVWATRDSKGIVHVMIINKETHTQGNVVINLAGYGKATVNHLLATSYSAKSGVTISGQTFDGAEDGTLQGGVQADTLFPSSGAFTVPVAAASAVLVDLQQ